LCYPTPCAENNNEVGNYEHVYFSEVFHHGACIVPVSIATKQDSSCLLFSRSFPKVIHTAGQDPLAPMLSVHPGVLAGQGLKLLQLSIQCLEESCENFNIQVDQYLATDPKNITISSSPTHSYNGAIWSGKPERKNIS